MPYVTDRPLLAAVFLSIALWGCDGAPAGSSRGANLDDVFAVRQLLEMHQILVDRRDTEGYSMLFSEDAVYKSPFAEAVGRAEIEQMSRSLHDSGFTRNMRHFSGPAHIIIENDTAEAVSYWWVADYSAEPPAVTATGEYHDTLRKTGTRWYFTSRRLIQDGPDS